MTTMTTVDSVAPYAHDAAVRSAYKTGFGAAGAVILAAVRSVRRWNRIRRATLELHRLDDRMLSDIGLSRSTLYVAARERAPLGDRNHARL